MRAPRRCIRRALNQRFEFGAMDADAACSETHRDSYEAHARDARGSSASPPHWLQPVRRPCFTACFRRSAQQAPLTYKGRASALLRVPRLDRQLPRRMGHAEARRSKGPLRLDVDRYSVRSASIGLTRVARSAGTKQDAAATVVSNAATAV